MEHFKNVRLKVCRDCKFYCEESHYVYCPLCSKKLEVLWDIQRDIDKKLDEVENLIKEGKNGNKSAD